MSEIIRSRLLANGETLSIDDKHIYTVENVKVPSVSAILNIIHKEALVFWAAKEAADYIRNNLESGMMLTQGEINRLANGAKFAHKKKSDSALAAGTLAHNYAEQYAIAATSGMPAPELPDNQEAATSINSFLEWVDSNDIKFLKTEIMLYSNDLKIAGTCDTIMEMDGKVIIADYKTSNMIRNEYLYQVSAYKSFYEEEFGEAISGACVIRFPKNGDPFEHYDLTEKDLETGMLAIRGARMLFKAIHGY
jgi:hypothetical protein